MQTQSYPAPEALRVAALGPCTHPSPMSLRRSHGFVDDSMRVLLSADAADTEAMHAAGTPLPSFECAGARERLFFEPGGVTCGIVTCGGLCPGINNVIRALTMTALHAYGVKRVLGFRYGYAGLHPDSAFAPVELTHDAVDHVHEQGGTMLGSSRGPQEPAAMVDTLVRHGVDMLFAVGGDGTQRGALALTEEIARRGLRIAVVGIPKTIDNDLSWINRSFGFTTAVEEARTVLQAAHIEARGMLRGVGLVKLMGRHSGFIAAHACLANHDVDFCLVPEVPEPMDGEGGFLDALAVRLDRRGHALIVVAEGFGQDLLRAADLEVYDASGNVRLGDIGAYLRDRIIRFFEERAKPVAMKYIDPSYTIRSLPACGADAAYCLSLGQHAVHAAMAGRTGIVVGFWNQEFTHVPMALMTGRRKLIDPSGAVWLSVLDATGQRAYYRHP